MAKGKGRSNSPKRSRRGGRRSPKKSKQGVQKAISKGESEPAQLHEPKEIEEPDCECDIEDEAEEPKQLPKMAEAPVADLSTVKADLVQFFWDSFEEESRAELKSLSQHEEQFFLFGKVGASLAKSGKFTEEVEGHLAMVWKADEAWVRMLLGGEVELPTPEPEEPEAPMEQVETVEEATETADVEIEGQKEEVEVAAEVAAEAPMPEVVAEEVVEPTEVVAPAVIMEEKVFEDVAMQEFQAMVNETVAEVVQPESIPEPVFDKENPMIAEAVKTVASKLGEQSIGSAVDCLSPQNLNVAQPLDLA